MLYKYLPDEFAVAFMSGEILFRSLSYFRRIEHAARGDESEGVHIDAPDNDVTLENLSTGEKHVGRYRFLNSINQERVFALCLSTRLDPALFMEFDADACVAITKPAQFFGRLAAAVSGGLKHDKPGIIHRPVAYWAANADSPLPIKDPRAIPFLKHESFTAQSEYRAVFARPGGFTLTQRIVTPDFTFEEEIRAAPISQQMLRIGPLRGLAEIRRAP